MHSIFGCSGAEPRGEIRGKVTLQGQPVEAGTIVFSNQKNGVHMTATINSSGNYYVSTANGNGLPLGEYAVFLYPPLVDSPGPRQAPGPNVTPPQLDPRWPQRYRGAKSSGLSVTVSSGVNVFDVDMVP